jgi:hypothetical protein
MQPSIDLPALIDVAMHTPIVPHYVDRVSGEVLPAAEVTARCGRAVAVQERYLRVPTIAARLRLDDARDFAAALPEGVLRRRVEKLLHGPRAPWAFERELARWPELAAAWYQWERRCTTARLLGWLGRSGIPFAYPS